MNEIEKVEADLADNRARQAALRETEAELKFKRSVMVTDADRAEMKRRGWYTHTWSVTEAWAAAHVCPFCRTACASSRQGKDFPNEQNAEYRCGNRGAL